MIKSLKFKIPAIIVIYMLIILLFSSIILINNIEVGAMDEKLNKNMVISEMMSRKLSVYLDGAMQNVKTAAKFASGNENDHDKIISEIYRLYDNFEYFDLAFFMDTGGHMVYAKPYNSVAINKRIYTDRDYYNHVMTYEEPFISKLYISRVLGKPHFVVVAPVFDSEGQLYGLIAAGIPLFGIKNVILDSEESFNGGIWVVDSYGSLVVDPYNDLSDDEVISMDNSLIDIDGEEYKIYDVILDKIKGIGHLERNGIMYYGAITYVDEASLMVMVEQEESALLKEVYTLIDDLRITVVIVVLISLIVGLYLANRIVNPIGKLVKAVRELSSGKKNTDNFTKNSEDEIGELFTAFNELTIKLDEKVYQLEESYVRENKLQQYLNNILKSAGSGIIVVDKNNKLTVFNSAAEHITKYSEEEVINKNYNIFSDYIKINLKSIIKDVIKTETASIDVEHNLIRKDGKSIPCSITTSPVLDENKNIAGFVFLLKDLEHVKQLEEELKREDRINILGEFSSSIIHDIGNPLAGLSNLLELYKSDWVNDNEKKEILNLIDGEIYDLNDLVVNFLNFSRQNNVSNSYVDIRVLIDEVINILKIEIIDKNIIVNKNYLTDKVYLNINRRSMKQALINIIKNSIQAIKEKGYIYIEIREKSSNIEIVIRDTGIGISEENMQNIFEPFYSNKKNGTGLGLSIAYKTIRENNGEINVESKLGKGTQFIINMPADNARREK